MASAPFKPNFAVLTAGGTIAKGHALKFGSDDKTVVECTATTDESIGLAWEDAVVGDPVEVCLPGGGGKAKLNATVTRGQLLTSDTNGQLKKIAAANDRIIAMAHGSGVQNDIIPVMVVAGQGTATES
jgi:hypothetical protein